jgi:hypothetical protein
MTIGNKPGFLKALRLAVGVPSVVAGALVLWSHFAGPDPVRIGSGTSYYQLVATPPRHAVPIGVGGVCFGLLLIFLPALRRKPVR